MPKNQFPGRHNLPYRSPSPWKSLSRKRKGLLKNRRFQIDRQRAVLTLRLPVLHGVARKSVKNGIEAGLTHDFRYDFIFVSKRNPALAGLMHDQKHAQAGRGDVVEAAAIHLYGINRLL